VIGESWYSSHRGVDVLFPTGTLPPLGYRTFLLHEAPEPVAAAGSTMPAANVLQNEHLRVEVDPPSGAVSHLVDLASGFDYVPEG